MSQRLIVVSAFIIVLFTGCSSSLQKRSINFGIDMAQQGLWKEASYRWQAQMAKEGPSAALLNNLAIAAEADGKFEDAESLYQKALKLAPKHPVIQGNYDQFVRLKEGKEQDLDKPGKKRRGRPGSDPDQEPPQGEER